MGLGEFAEPAGEIRRAGKRRTDFDRARRRRGVPGPASRPVWHGRPDFQRHHDRARHGDPLQQHQPRARGQATWKTSSPRRFTKWATRWACSTPGPEARCRRTCCAIRRAPSPSMPTMWPRSTCSTAPAGWQNNFGTITGTVRFANGTAGDAGFGGGAQPDGSRGQQPDQSGRHVPDRWHSRGQLPAVRASASARRGARGWHRTAPAAGSERRTVPAQRRLRHGVLPQHDRPATRRHCSP